MSFDSIIYAIFLPLVFGIYWIIPKDRTVFRNLVLLVASYIFYAWWDWRFLGLIVFSSLVDFFIGFALHREDKTSQRRFLLVISLLVNLGLLFVFKYYNFFIDSFVDAFRLIGIDIASRTLNIMLPVGISFYTFQTLSYTLEIFHRRFEPERSLVNYMTYVSFFPQLVTGPIERPQSLIPQFRKAHVFRSEEGSKAMRQILWGLFKKVVIADNCAIYVNMVFGAHTDYSASSLLLAAILFSFQIYGDFSGYSDIAIGSARLFGIKLRQNFAFPYFSRDIAEFWRRWHISLTTWFRDYVYIPMGGSRASKARIILNVFVVFIISGIWHGANWTFVAWGAVNALLFVPLIVTGINRRNMEVIEMKGIRSVLSGLIAMAACFLLVSLGWIFFRSESISQAFDIFLRLGDSALFSLPAKMPRTVLALTFFMLIVEWLGRRQLFALEDMERSVHRAARWFFYFLVLILIVLYGAPGQEFIYFQF